MSKRRTYLPSETHIALHPPRTLIDCPCGVRFEARSSSLAGIDSDDDPKLCLACNRKSWSRLWNGNQPVENTSTIEMDSDTSTKRMADVSAIDFDLISDNDVGEVVPIWRPRR